MIKNYKLQTNGPRIITNYHEFFFIFLSADYADRLVSGRVVSGE